MKFPIGIQNFKEIRTKGFCYIDKTDLIYNLIDKGKIYFLSRPRRFGKSLLISTLEHYFLGHKELFKGLAIEPLETEWKEYPVFHIDFNGNNYTTPGTLTQVLDDYVCEWESIYGRSDNESTLGNRFEGVLKRACQQTGRQAVVLIDEYDKPMLDVMDTQLMNADQTLSLEQEHINILSGFYSTLKKADEYLKFVFLTGVTKFAHVSVFSGFNSPADISLVSDYETLCGITTTEMLAYFQEPIQELADKFKISYDEMVLRLKKQYDGYHFSEDMTDIYNPFSLLNALCYRNISDYWFASGTPSYLVRLMSHNDMNIEELVNCAYTRDQFLDNRATPEDPLPILFQSGYLTIKEYNERRYTYRLDFPNGEVRSGLIPLLMGSYMNATPKEISDFRNLAFDLSDALEFGDTKSFFDHMNAFLSDIPYNVHDSFNDPKNTEKFFQMVFYLTMRLVGSNRLTTRVEQTQAKGRVDCIVEAPDYVYIIEFKLDGTADEALQQIAEKKYAAPYATDSRQVVCIGASFSSKERDIEEWKVVQVEK